MFALLRRASCALGQVTTHPYRIPRIGTVNKSSCRVFALSCSKICNVCSFVRPKWELDNLLGLGAQVGGSVAFEKAGEEWLHEGAEDDLSTTVIDVSRGKMFPRITNLPSLWEGHPEHKNELEHVVEWEPVDGVDGRLNHGEKGVDNPVLLSLRQYTKTLLLSFLKLPRTVSH